MPVSTMMPDVTVEIAFTTAPGDPNPVWVDVSDYVEAVEGIDISRGRADELSQVQPSTLSVTLDNRDGRFTPERAGSPYYPNVKKSKRIRVSARLPGNFVTNSRFETDAAGWAPEAGYAGGSVARSTVRAQEGVGSALITWAASGTSVIGTSVTGLVIDKTYTASAYVYVPTGNADVWLTRAHVDSGPGTSTKNAWVRISHTFVATSSTHVIGVAAATSTAGQQCWVDAVQVDEGSTVVAFTTASPTPPYRRVSGYIDEWPLEWQDGTSSVARSRITATSRQARLAKGAELRSIIECEYLQDNPSAYYTFGDPEGTTRAGNVSTSIQPPMTAVHVGTGGGIFFGTATGPGTDDLTAATFTRADNNNGFYMRSIHDQDIVSGSDTSLLMECFFSTTTADGIADIALIWLDSDGGQPAAWSSTLGVSATGKLQATGAVAGSVYVILTSAATVSDGATHHAALRQTTNGTTITSTLFLDGVAVASSANAASWGGRSYLKAGGPSFLFNGTMAHVAVYSGTTEITSARILQHALSGLTGFSGERSDQRIARLARYAGVPASEVATETGLSVSLVNQMTTGAQPIALMQDVAKTESGTLFDAGDGALTFQARSHRYGSMSSLTLSATLQEIEGGLNPRLDDQGMANDITTTRAAGIAMRVTDTASITDYGVYRDDLTLLTTDDNEVSDAAYWGLNQRSQPLLRIAACSVDLLNASTSQKTALLGLELGDKITLTGLPTQAPAPSLDFFVEGIVERLGDQTYTMTLNLSPAARYGVWQLDSAAYSQLGSTTRLAY